MTTVGSQSRQVSMTEWGMKEFLKSPEMASKKKWKRAVKALAREFVEAKQLLKFRITRKNYEDKEGNARTSYR